MDLSIFGFIAVRGMLLLGLVGAIVWLDRNSGKGRRRDAIPAQGGGYVLVEPDLTRVAEVMVGLTALLGVALWVESLLGRPQGDWTGFGLLGALFLLFAVLIRGLGNKVVIRVDAQGVEKVRWWREPKRIQWAEVESVSYSEWFDHRLVVTSRTGRKVWVSHHLQGLMGLLIYMEEQLEPEQYQDAVNRILPKAG